MEFRNLGNSDLKVSILGLGGNTFGPPRIDEPTSIKVIHAAQDVGINYVDTDVNYTEGESEKYIGRALADGRRPNWVIGTKFSLRRLEGKSAWDVIHESCETSLKKLGTDHIDLYQIRSIGGQVPEEEILRALDDLVQSGKVREIGASGYMSWQLAESILTARSLGIKPLATTTNHYNLLRRQIEAELVPACAHFGLSLIPYFPLGGGFLTGKYQRDVAPPPGTRGAEGSGVIKLTGTDRNWEIVPKLEQFATERGHTIGELAFAWLFANPVIGTVISGASNPEQVQMNVKATNWQLTPEEKEELDRLAPREGDDSGQRIGARGAVHAT